MWADVSASARRNGNNVVNHGVTDISVSETKDEGFLFIKITLDLLADPSVSLTAKAVYGRMTFFSGKNGFCNPSLKTLAKAVALKESRIREVLVELRECGLISWTRTRSSSHYTVHPLECRKTDNQTAGIPTVKSAGKPTIKRSSRKRGSSKDVDLDCPIPRNQAAVIPKPSPKRYPQVSNALAGYRTGGGPKRPPQSAYPSDAMVAEIMAAAGGNSESWVIAQLVHLHNERGLRWGTTTGPRTWQWFVTVLADRAERAERLELARAPENTWDHDGTRLAK